MSVKTIHTIIKLTKGLRKSVLCIISTVLLVACTTGPTPERQQAHFAADVAQYATGTPYDGKIRIDGTAQLEPRENTFLLNVAHRDSSLTHVPLIMRDHTPMRKIIESVLINRGLLFAGDVGRASGLLAPKSTAPYGLQTAAIGYYNESLIREEGLGSRILGAMASGRPERITREMLNRGYYEVKAV